MRLEGGCVGGGVAWTGRRGLGLPQSGGSGQQGNLPGRRTPGQRQRDGLGLGARPGREDAPTPGAVGGAGWGREVLPAALRRRPRSGCGRPGAAPS